MSTLKSVEEMFSCLIQHGCPDLSSSLDPSRFSLFPIANGGFGDVYRVSISGGPVLAVKTLRLPKLLAGNAAKVSIELCFYLLYFYQCVSSTLACCS